jgi:hypothetical protein
VDRSSRLVLSFADAERSGSRPQVKRGPPTPQEAPHAIAMVSAGTPRPSTRSAMAAGGSKRERVPPLKREDLVERAKVSSGRRCLAGEGNRTLMTSMEVYRNVAAHPLTCGLS